ncbi:MAG: DUF6516 family protein [Abditibacteriales bacterium]|nr:DUF6516 family protein [Abditibacteriales bacterium]MDW8364490.1 DUF6516 family protein [Abditibacteriales bacterium]
MARLSSGRKKSEVRKFIREELRLLHETDFVAYIEPFTWRVERDGTGLLYVPSLATFERLTPDATPTGVVMRDGSFMAVKLVVRFDYPDGVGRSTSASREPCIVYVEYSFHYQRPQDCTFFRYDFHPHIGDPRTHPIFHVHAAGWQRGDKQLPDKPRLPSSSMTLSEVLDVVRMNYFTEEA